MSTAALLLGSLLTLAALPVEGHLSRTAAVQDPEPSFPPLRLSATDEAATTELDAYLKALAKDDRFSGVVLVAREDQPWFEKAYGFASREFRVPNTVETRFDVGSLTKSYTQLALDQLRQLDALSLDDVVGTFLPDYPNERVREEVTIGQLLDHTSGLGDMFTPAYLRTPMGALRETADYLPIWGPDPLRFEPGSRQEYSNFGYTVLGAILESITGTSYADYVQEAVFEPAGMTSSGFFEIDAIVPRVAVGYTRFDRTGRPTDVLRKNVFHEPAKGGPWGKSYSTARDVLRFYAALFAGELSEEPVPSMPRGWNGGFGDAGGGPGMSALMAVERGNAVVVLANQDEPAAEEEK